jgi:ribulose-phosphate 3-epimerase
MITNMTNNQYKLSASMVCADMLNIGSEIEKLEAGKIDHLHFDVMDGDFVPRLGLHPEMLSAMKKKTDLPIDVHLMISNPEKYIPEFVEAGADYIIVHAESTNHLDHCLRLIKKLGAKAGVGLNPATPLSVLDYILDDIDMIMLIAINPGIVGHKIIPKSYEKISDVKKKVEKYPNMIIEIDGGVKPETAPLMIKAGANMLVCGTGTIFKPPGIIENIKNVREHIDKELSNI